MRVIQWDPADTGTAAALYEVWKAAHLADEPIEPPMSRGTHRSVLTGDWDGAAFEVWHVPDERGGAVAYYGMYLPDLENLNRAFLQLFVHPEARRHGTGAALVRHAAERAAAHGRAILESVTLAKSPGDAFAREMGAKLSLEEARRVQDLGKVPPDRVAELRAEAERSAAGYSLVTWTGPFPDEYAGQVAGVFNAFEDAPRPDGVEPDVWDADRIRERTGRLAREGHLRAYSVAALHDLSGEMAALSEVAIDPEQPEWGYQGLTAVTRPHRGHRLGMATKTAMMQWLSRAEPRLRWIATGNAVANAHMIAVNEALGYEVAHPWYRFYELPVA
jgi:GNAT superfamily N-acetyltransferase